MKKHDRHKDSTEIPSINKMAASKQDDSNTDAWNSCTHSFNHRVLIINRIDY